jgi:hypothetical protein
MELTAADAPILLNPHAGDVAGVTPMYRIRFRGYRSQWSAAPHGTTPRQFVQSQTRLDMAAVQSVSRIFIEYAFSVDFVVVVARARREADYVLIAGQRYPTEGSTEAHVRPVVDAFVRRHAEQYGYVAPMDGRPSSPLTSLSGIGGRFYRVGPLEGCSFCARDTNICRVGHVNSCLDEDGTCTRGPFAALEMHVARMRGAPSLPPSAPALTDAPSEFDPPHVERLRLLYAMALCMQRAPHQTAPLGAGLASTTIEFRGMVADALVSRVGIFGH